MPRNGSGTYSLPNPPFVAGTTINAAPVNGNLSDIGAALTGSIAADGQTPWTGDQNANGHAITGLTSIAGTSTAQFLNVGAGCLVRRTSNQTIPSGINTAITWSTEDFDAAGIWTISDPTRLTVPATITRVRLTAGVEWASRTGGFVRVNPRMNGGGTQPHGLPRDARDYTTSFNVTQNIASGIIVCAPGDYFELIVQQSTGALDVVAGDYTWFCMELLR